MARGSVDMNLLFTLGEVQRLVRAYADKQAARYGITRAQWAVLAKVERSEGLKQSELAELAGSNAAATTPTAASTASICARPRVRCSAS